MKNCPLPPGVAVSPPRDRPATVPSPPPAGPWSPLRTPESDCFLQTPGAPGPCSGPGPDSYFSLSAKDLSFIMQFTLIFFFFFVNTFMNEDSVLPNLLPDLLPTHTAQLPGRGWGSGALLGGVPDHCLEQPLPPSLGVSTKQGAHLLKPFSPWGSSEHGQAQLFLLLAALLH